MGLISDAAEHRGDWARRQAEAERKAAQDRTARRAENTAISANGIKLVGGDITVDDQGSIIIRGGNLIMTDADETTGLVYIGTGSDGQRIWAFAFRDGETAFRLSGADDASYWSLRDHGGRLLMSNDGVTGVGLARPYLQYHLQPMEDAEQSGTSFWPSTTATAAGTDLLGIVTPVEHPRLQIGVAVTTTGGGTGHWRLRIESSAGDTTVISDETSFGIHTVDIPGWGTDVFPGQQVVIAVQAWVTGGGTRAFVQYDRCFGLGS